MRSESRHVPPDKMKQLTTRLMDVVVVVVVVDGADIEAALLLIALIPPPLVPLEMVGSIILRD